MWYIRQRAASCKSVTALLCIACHPAIPSYPICCCTAGARDACKQLIMSLQRLYRQPKLLLLSGGATLMPVLLATAAAPQTHNLPAAHTSSVAFTTVARLTLDPVKATRRALRLQLPLLLLG